MNETNGKLPQKTYPALLFLFLLSGAAALTYEVLWLRWFSITLGSSTISLTIILMAFMGGLALGSWKLGRLADQLPLERLPLLFVAIEVGIGLYALILPGLLELVEGLYVEIYRYLQPGPLLNSALRGTTALLLLLLPTTLMGGSLPVMSRYLNHINRGQALSVDVSRLYAWNTLGAIVGTLLTGYLWLAHLGIAATNVLAALINFSVALIFWFSVARHYRHGNRPLPPTRSPLVQPAAAVAAPLAPPLRRLLLIGYGFSGLAAFLYQISWTRVLEMVLGTTTYAFTVMLATFLLGIALGSAIYARIPARISRLKLFLTLQMVVVIGALFTSIWLEQFPIYYLKLHADLFDTWFGVQFMRFLLAALVMLVPTTAMGVLFPVVTALTVGERQQGEGVGSAYGVNTIGAAIGSALAGLLLIPLLGMQQTILLGAGINLLVVLVVLVRQTQWSPRYRWQRGGGGAAALLAAAVAG